MHHSWHRRTTTVSRGYARYFQQAPHLGHDDFASGTTFEQLVELYRADEALRVALVAPLARVEILLRAHTAYVIAKKHGPRGSYLEADFYADASGGEATLNSCLRDIERSTERHILRFRSSADGPPDLAQLPVWSAVEAWSFGTLSRCIERGAKGSLAHAVATSLGAAKAGFAYRVRSLVYLRNRCAHHSRLWNHSVVDAGPPALETFVHQHDLRGSFWQGLAHPKNTRDH